METADVIVIGAGMSGLTCARSLQRAGLRTVVVEARDRIGGRIQTLRIGEHAPVELGAQVVHGRAAATWHVILEGGLRVASLERPERFAFRIDDAVLSVGEFLSAGGIPPWELEQHVGRGHLGDLPVAEILAAKSQRALDYETACEWMMHRWSGPASEMSDAGMTHVKSSWDAGEGEFVLADGYEEVPAVLAGGLDVRLKARVAEVRWAPGSVEVQAEDHEFSARAAALTIPPTVVAAGGLRFRPELPTEKLSAARSIDLGDALVVIGVAEPAPWSACGLAVGRRGGLWQARRGSPLFAGSFRGPNAASVRAAGVDAGLVSSLVAPLFPWVQEDAIRQLFVADWGEDPFTLGAFSYPRVGSLEVPRVWAAPLGNTLFFAGEATCSSCYVGLVQGAIESGLRAADAIVAALTRPAEDVPASRTGRVTAPGYFVEKRTS